MITQVFEFMGAIFDALMLAAQAWCIGGVIFILMVARPLGDRQGEDRFRRWIKGGALALALAELLSLSAPVSSLVGRLGLSLTDALTADFALWHGAAALAALALAGLTGRLSVRRPWLLILPIIALMVAAVMTSHAASRLDGRLLLGISHISHVLAASVWIGGIPYLLGVLAHSTPIQCGPSVRRFSTMAVVSVAVLTVSAAILSYIHIRTLAGLVGGEYGGLVMVKLALLGCLLMLGLGNFLTGQRLETMGPGAVDRIKVFAEVEIGMACAVLLVAASLGGQPPPIDLPNDLVSPAQMLERITPHWPRFFDPPVITDQSWSEVNHNVSGLIVTIMGLMALLNHTGLCNWARHWPLLFTAFVWIVIRSDPDSWPMGDCAFLGCNGGDPEVIQHRLLTFLPMGFGIVEWMVRTGRITNPAVMRAFPLFCAVGGALLLTHSHQIGDTRARYLVEFTHLPMGMFGIMAGWSRWLELRADGPIRVWAGWFWPFCLTMVGLLLLDYRES